MCVPRKVVANAAILSADIDEISTIKDFNQTIDKLAKVIVHWNTKMKYIERNAKKEEGGNCQDVQFVLFSNTISFAKQYWNL